MKPQTTLEDRADEIMTDIVIDLQRGSCFAISSAGQNRIKEILVRAIRKERAVAAHYERERINDG